jgi:ERCC4-type nuclease
MCILIDDREDSALEAHLQPFGIPVSVVRLDFGDIAIQSGDEQTLVGFERKRLTDLIASMQDRRLSGFQLKGMRQMYDRQELIIEGIWRPADDGSIEIPQRFGSRVEWRSLYHRGSGISFRQVDSYLYSQTECGDVRVWSTRSTQETAHLLASRWFWWQKDYSAHKSVDALFTNDPTKQKRGAVTIHGGDPSPVVLVAAQIPTIDSIAWEVGRYFKSVEEMATATETDWRKVPWTDRSGKVKHFGKERAREIVRWLKENNHEQAGG